MVRAIIVDDDKTAHALIQRALDIHCPDIRIVGNALGVEEGIRCINENKPELIFLDIRMVDGSGLDLLSHFHNPFFRVIIVSAFTEYAIQGYKFDVVDYIMKPIKEKELIKAVTKATDLIRSEKSHSSGLPADEPELNKGHRKIILKTIEQIYIINIDDILHIESDGNYSTVYLEESKKVVVSKPIKEFEEILKNSGFFRVHKSHIINMNKVRLINKALKGALELADGSVVPVSSRRRDLLIGLFSSF
ncbi:MAG: LytR/AlgR family response regulator transcription factor [Lentimicrobium sp.]